MRRTFSGLLAALVIALLPVFSTPAESRSEWLAMEGYDWWNDCSALPDDFEFLNIYLGNEGTGPIDLARMVSDRESVRWRAVQYTRDKDFGQTRVGTGRWYAGMGSEQWPRGTVDAREQLRTLRLAWEIDGNRHTVDPACILTLETDDETIGLFNAWVRFREPGVHAVKIIARQVLRFFFIYPFAETGLTDPFGLEGRRVFVEGETIGDVLDGDFVHTYELHAGRD